MLLSDMHVTGPEYAIGGESGELDNESVTKSQMRLFEAVKEMNTILQQVHPRPKKLLVIGDAVHEGLQILNRSGYSLDAKGIREMFQMKTNSYTMTSTLLSMIDVDIVFCMGNHDLLVDCEVPEQSVPLDVALQVYEHYFGAPLYQSIDLDAWKIISLNSMLGSTWDPSSTDCATKIASYGKKQLQWLDRELHDALQDDKHVVILTHFAPILSKLNEVAHHKYSDLKTVVERYGNVKLILSGHLHKGVQWKDGVYTLPSTRYSSQNYFMLDLYRNGSFSIADWKKNRFGSTYPARFFGSRCSDRYFYNDTYPDGVYGKEYEGLDSGSCGKPRVTEELDWQLKEVSSLSDFPDVDIFNPEGSCRFRFAPMFFSSCVKVQSNETAMKNCCQVLEKAFYPSSRSPLAVCFCQESFWTMSQEHFKMHGINISSILGQCIDRYQRFILFPNGGPTWC